MTVEGKTLEQILLQIVEKRGMKRWWGLLQKNLLPDTSLGAICDTLGKIGTQESIRTLTLLEKSHKGSLTSKVREALKKIEERKNK